MLSYITRRLLLMIPTLIGITFLVFMLVASAGGGIGAALRAQGGALQSQSGVAVQQAYLEDRYGLDAPIIVQYGRWLGRISPIKIGTRDQVAPNGERIRPPKALRDPTLWHWFAEGLPAEPGTAQTEGDVVSRFRGADRKYADIRAGFIAAEARLKEGLKEYVRQAGVPNATDSEGKVRIGVLQGLRPDTSVASWSNVLKLGQATIDEHAKARAARAELAKVFSERPYPEAGIGIGPVSLANPDFGTAFSRGRPVMDLIRAHLPVTLLINFIAFPIIYLVAIPSGMLAATKRGTLADTGLGVMFIGLWSFPVVLAGVLSIGFLASKDYLHLFPVSGLHDKDAETYAFLPSMGPDGFDRGFVLDTLWHLALPVACLAYGGFAVLSKQTRAAMLDNFNADYVRTAKAKGVSGRDIVLKHVFRNSLLPLITMFVAIFPAMLAGSVVIERIFTLPGMGSLIIEAITLRDRELILADVAMIAVVNMVALLLADVLYAMADPRVSYR
jgi:ABC-type dipeptide/oligopeptide/nickel transport system permease component